MREYDSEQVLRIAGFELREFRGIERIAKENDLAKELRNAGVTAEKQKDRR